MRRNLKILLIVNLLAILVSYCLVQKLGKKLNPIIRSYSLIEAERFGVYMINYSLDKDFISDLDDDIFTTTTNSNDEIQIIDFKTKKVNELLEKATNRIQKNLIDLENGEIREFDFSNTLEGFDFKKIKKGVVCEIPEGIIFSNVLLANSGPSIPIKLNFIGQVSSNIQTKVESYGINSVYLEVFIHVEVKERVTMPLRTEEVTVSTDIPLAMKIIQGNIPNYYQSPIISDSREFSLPIS